MLFFFFYLLLPVFKSLMNQTYYVKSNGNNISDGSYEFPFINLSIAFNSTKTNPNLIFVLLESQTSYEFIADEVFHNNITIVSYLWVILSNFLKNSSIFYQNRNTSRPTIDFGKNTLVLAEQYNRLSFQNCDLVFDNIPYKKLFFNVTLFFTLELTVETYNNLYSFYYFYI